MPKRQPTWTHKKVRRYIAEYKSMLTRMGIPISHVADFGDAAEILQSIELEDRGGFKPTWISGPLTKEIDEEKQIVCYVHMDVESLSEPKNRPYEVKVILHHTKKDNLFTANYEDMDHACKDSQFSGKYRHRGGVVSPDHHQITARRTMEKNLERWCRKAKQPEIKMPRLYTDVEEPHRTELLKILHEEVSTLKSIQLRERIYVYLHDNGIKLYEFD